MVRLVIAWRRLWDFLRDSDNRGALSVFIGILSLIITGVVAVANYDLKSGTKSELRVADAPEKLSSIDSLVTSQEAQQAKVSGLRQNQVFRYRVTGDVGSNPGFEWLLNPPLSAKLSAVQILFWSGDGHIKITSAGHGRPIGERQQFAFPQILEGMVFELRIYHADSNTIIKLVFPEQEALYPGAELRIPGIRSISGTSDVSLLAIEPS